MYLTTHSSHHSELLSACRSLSFALSLRPVSLSSGCTAFGIECCERVLAMWRQDHAQASCLSSCFIQTTCWWVGLHSRGYVTFSAYSFVNLFFFHLSNYFCVNETIYYHCYIILSWQKILLGNRQNMCGKLPICSIYRCIIIIKKCAYVCANNLCMDWLRSVNSQYVVARILPLRFCTPV